MERQIEQIFQLRNDSSPDHLAYPSLQEIAFCQLMLVLPSGTNLSALLPCHVVDLGISIWI